MRELSRQARTPSFNDKEREVLNLPPQKLTIKPPEGGWKPHTFYRVRVSYRTGNPIHDAILGIGFVNQDGTPGNYSEIWNNCYDGASLFSDAHYVEVVQELFTTETRQR